MINGRRLSLAAGAIAAISGALVLAMAFLPGLFGMSLAIVSSGSMSPALEPGDAIYSKAVDPAGISPGDVIVFEAADGRDTVHRAVLNDIISKQVTTKGDANPEQDPEPVPYGAVKGRLVFRCHGWITAFLSGSGAAAAVFLLGTGCMLLVMAATYGGPDGDGTKRRRNRHGRDQDDVP